MRGEVYQYIRSEPDLHKFLRAHPNWYRRLARNPYSLQEMEKQAKIFFGKTFPQRMEKLENNMHLAMMMIDMMRSFNQSN
ncbi:YlbE-like family protein [Bacillus shivajii]|uniref:YlbE-like family protein n=1 Tax=Bacillus shivajii TaxID=1983719 RepID=UPI001CFA0075|nr:YlbE-like family protein [Bacillus shivajii]UCZ51853.1 YlbE-like family protein [Bacillus shivajii]